jgi:hypothetical protein
MVSPIGLLTRVARPARPARAIGRCPVCHDAIRDGDSMLTLRGGIHVHQVCATYRIRQRARSVATGV